jgi:pilus assembly protein FimV
LDEGDLRQDVGDEIEALMPENPFGTSDDGEDDIGLDLDLDALEALAAEPIPPQDPPADTAAPLQPRPGAGGEDSEEVPRHFQPAADVWDEAATKLDLARAYLEMQDPDAARSILDEVVAGGNAEQQAEAERLLRSLG